MTSYRHVQRGTWLVAVMLVGAIFVVLGGLVLRPLFIVLPLLLLSAWLFHSLTVEIGNGELRWHFGPGLISKRVLLNQIRSTKPVQTNLLEGWGIHLSRFGWLYNVSGYDAVAITLKDGKRFALGTDEPGALASAITEATSAAV